MQKQILAIIASTVILFSNTSYKDSDNKILLCEKTKKQVSIQSKNDLFENFMKLYENKKKENEERKKEEERKKAAQIAAQKAEEAKQKKLDRGIEFSYREIPVNCIVTYYSNIDDEMQGGQNDKKGRSLLSHSGNICAVPKDIPYGSILELDGMGTYKCVDSGGAINWIDSNTMKVDVFVPNATYSQLMKLGKKKVKGTLYRK